MLLGKEGCFFIFYGIFVELCFPKASMSNPLRFEQLKQEFINSTTVYLDAIKNLSYDNIYNKEAGVRLIEMRANAVTSSINLSDFISKARYDNMAKNVN